MRARRLKPRYEDLSPYRRGQVAACFNDALNAVERRGREAGMPEGKIDAMRRAVIRFPKNTISTADVNRIYARHAKK